jgi:hypothetical protein
MSTNEPFQTIINARELPKFIKEKLNLTYKELLNAIYGTTFHDLEEMRIVEEALQEAFIITIQKFSNQLTSDQLLMLSKELEKKAFEKT